MATEMNAPDSNVMWSFGSLFSGIGGLDLGLERAGWRCSWQVENEPYCRKVLAKHWPDVPKFGDIKELKTDELSPVRLVAGGFPCQDVSDAGQHAAPAGIDGKRSGLWTEMLRVIRDLRPDYVLVENVPGLLVRGLDRVLGGLAEVGYDAEWDCVPAAFIGADHLRTRVWILAYPCGFGPSSPYFDLQQLDRGGWWETEPRLERVADGPASRVDRDRTRAIGNAVVPQAAELMGLRLKEVA